MRQTIASFFVITLLLAACAHTQKFADLSAWNEKSGESVQLSVRMLKRKTGKADVTIAIKNDYPFRVVIPENSLRFSINGDEGLGARNPRWVLKSGDAIVHLITVKFAMDEKGPGVLTLQHVYSGTEISVSGVNTTSTSQGFAVGASRRSVAAGFAASKTDSKSEEYLTKSAVEGTRLPDVTLTVP